MRIQDMSWRDVETYLKTDDRVVLPLGSVEQHDGLSLATDLLIGEKLALDAAGPLGVPVYPVLPYGFASFFQSYPGSVHIRLQTYLGFVRDILDSLRRSGFRRIFILNAHGGNTPVDMLGREWMMDNPDCRVRFYEWWKAAPTLEKIATFEPVNALSHASWMENFPWTRLDTTDAGAEAARVNADLLATHPPEGVRAMLGGGNYGGAAQRPDADTLAVWEVAVADTRAAMERW